MKQVIQIQNVIKRFGDRAVLNGINFNIHEGETLVIMGGSGCGKSTLLRNIIGLMRPEEGRIMIFGKDMASAPDEERNQIRKSFGMLFQGSALFNSLTVGENVALPLKEHTQLDEQIIKIIVKVKLELVGLTGFEGLKPYEISGGMKKRVALARAIALDPKIVFYDEPGAGLDPITASVIDHLIMDLSKKLKMTSVVVTHEMKSAFRIADRMVMLHQGRVIAEGTAEDIRNSTNPYVHQFIHGEMDGPDHFQKTRDDYLKGIFGNV
ncbi:MAG: ABC transporter ATP-binding protein [Omnitrophica bacterium GWA2_52_8]|nr:MAG: ABC transporter ATP-binding protein [Omnitrophica bacterium GWA2_52_8]